MLSALMPRNILSVELVPTANAVLNETAKRTRLKKKDLVARMCAWFAIQDLEVQKIVLGEIPDSLADAAKEMAINKLRGTKDGIFDVDEIDPVTQPGTDLPRRKNSRRSP